tara:strand:+ start:284 stop:469 length:186 start_codon:yes stop_codon:yes gene_type:complete
MKTKYRNWKTTKSSSRAEETRKTLQTKYPELNFRVKTRTFSGKDKKSYSVQTISRAGSKTR